MDDLDSLSNTELTKLFNENKHKCREYSEIKDENTSRMPIRGLTHEEINKEKQLKKECETFQEILKAVKKRLPPSTGRKTKISRRNKSKTHKKSKKSSKTRK
jgi:hypothetical protein